MNSVLIFLKNRTNSWNFESTSVKIGQKLEFMEENEFLWKKYFFSKKINFWSKIAKNHDFFEFYQLSKKCSKITNFCPNAFKKILERVFELFFEKTSGDFVFGHFRPLYYVYGGLELQNMRYWCNIAYFVIPFNHIHDTVAESGRTINLPSVFTNITQKLFLKFYWVVTNLLVSRVTIHIIDHSFGSILCCCRNF